MEIDVLRIKRKGNGWLIRGYGGTDSYVKLFINDHGLIKISTEEKKK